MTTVRSLLLAFVLLLPSVALGQYDPSQDQNVVSAWPHPSDFPNSFRQTDATSTVAAEGDFVGTVITGTGTNWTQTTSTRRPKRSAGGLAFDDFDATQRGIVVASSTNLFKFMHETAVFRIKCRFKMDVLNATVSRSFFDNTNQTVSTALGVTFGSQNTGSAADGSIRLNNGATSWLARTGTLITDQAFHVLEAEGNGEYIRVRVDRDDWAYARIDSTLGSGAAAQNAHAGNRASFNLQLEGIIEGLWIGTGRATDEQEAAWLAKFPLGSFVGNPEMYNDDIHFNLEKNHAYCPTKMWFNNRNLNYAGTIDGVVYRRNEDADWQGGPHGPTATTSYETVNSCTVNGAAITNGETYGGSTGSFTMIRDTTIGAAFDQVHRVTLSGHVRGERVQLTRKNDGGTVNTLYIVRCARDSTFGPTIALDADGTELLDDTFNAGDNSVNNMPAGTKAVAQFSSTHGVMILWVAASGFESDDVITITDTANDKRLYVALSDAKENVVAGGTVTRTYAQYHYVTDSGSWQALAASELLKILSPPRGNPRIGLGIGIGLGSVERKSPAEEFLAAARANEVSLAP